MRWCSARWICAGGRSSMCSTACWRLRSTATAARGGVQKTASATWTPVYLGHAADVEVAEYLTVVLADATAQAWRAYVARFPGIDSRQRRKGQQSFLIGMANRLNERLREMKSARNAYVDESSGVAAGALVLVKSAAVDAAFAEIQKRFKPSRASRKQNVYADALRAGSRAADAVAINTAVAA